MYNLLLISKIFLIVNAFYNFYLIIFNIVCCNNIASKILNKKDNIIQRKKYKD